MAKITPYADINAHGSIGDSVTFRRRYGSVILQKKSNPKQPNSASQLAQRSAFKTASEDWYGYDAQSKIYFNTQGPQLGITGQNLFIKAQLLNIMPSLINSGLIEINEAQLGQSRVIPTAACNFYLFAGDYVDSFGSIVDPTNVWNKQSTLIANNWLLILVEADGADYSLKFRDWLWIKGKNLADDDIEYVIRFPQTTILDGESQPFYVSLDGSTFSDEALNHLDATNNF